MMRRKRIYFFVNDFGLTGSETLLSQFISDLSKDNRYKIFIVTTSKKSKSELELTNDIVFKSFNKDFSFVERVLFKVGVNVFKYKLMKLFSGLPPDIAYLNTVNNAYLLPYISQFNLVKILHVHELLMGLNSLDKKDFSNMILLTDELVTCSDLVTNLYGDIYTKKINQINSVPSFKNFDLNGLLENDHLVDSQKYKIACAGTICYRKGFDRFLEIAEKLDADKFTLYWFGKFDESAYSEWVKHKLLLPKFQHVIIISFPSQVTYLHALSKCDLFLFTSREESMGMVLFDAMHAGLPIISLEENGSKLILDNGKGKLIGTNDIVNIQNIVLDTIKTKSEKTKNSVSENNYQVEFAKFAQLFEKY